MGDWKMEPHKLAQAGWLHIVDGRVFSTPTDTCAGGAGAVLDYFVVSTAMAHLVQQVEVDDNSPTTPHWPVRLALKATSWGHRVLARRLLKPFPAEVPVGPRRQEELRMDLGGRRDPRRLGAGLAGVAASGRGCVVPYPRLMRSSTQAFSGQEQRAGHRARFPCPGNAQGHQEGFQQKGGGLARSATHCGTGCG